MRYFLIAGEASGDLHASNLMCEIKAIDAEAQFCFLGGDLMLSQGGEMVIHYRDMAFMGFFNVLKNSSKVLQNMERCKQAIREFHPDVVIPVDYPSFNLRIAKYVKETLQLPVYYYIAPKIWAWKEFRIKQIKTYVDNMFTIFPFETEFYKKHQYEVNYVGNPTVDSIAQRPNQKETFDEFCRRNELNVHKPIIAVLPGSRKQEISSCLPIILDGLRLFNQDYQIVVSGAPGVPLEDYGQFVKDECIPVVFGQTYELLAQARAAVVNSGTATLETALIGTPQVVVYHVALGRLALVLKRIFIHVKYVSLVNLIAGKGVVKELLAHHFTPVNVQQEVTRLLTDEAYRTEMVAGFHFVQQQLGEPGAAKNAATAIVAKLKLAVQN